MTAPGEDLKLSLIVPSSSRPSHPSHPSSRKANQKSSMSGVESLASLRNSLSAKADMNVNCGEPVAQASKPVEGKTTNATPIDHSVYGVDEFLSKYQAENKDLIAAREAGKAPAAKKLKMDENAAPAPVAIGAKSSKHTILLNDTHQALGLPQPHFTFGGSGESGWTAKVSFIGLDIEELQNIEEPDRFNSKQEAKEAVSKRALGILEALKEEGRVKTPVKGKKKKNLSTGEPAIQSSTESQPPVENYIGQLLEFQRSISAPPPIYTDYQAGTRFACLLEIEGHPTPFGSLKSLHGSKKAARHDAARCAVDHFKAQGTWPATFTDAGGIRKKKATQPAAVPERIPSNTSTPTPTTSTAAATSIPAVKSPSPATSYAAQVATLAAALSLPTPEYVFTPCADAPDFYTVVCVFRHGEPHAGPYGEVRNIFGRKKAKEECARLTLAVLDEVRKERAEFAEKMMAGLGAAGQGEGV